jgi:hypothetical protein
MAGSEAVRVVTIKNIIFSVVTPYTGVQVYNVSEKCSASIFSVE